MRTELEKQVYRLSLCNAAIFESANAWLASPISPDPRPLSLASMEALRQMQMPYETLDYESRQIALYRWLHVQPLRDVRLALWQGTWPILFADAEPLSEEIIATFRDDQKRIREMIAAVTVTVRKKPRKTAEIDDTPPDVIAPTLAWHRIVTVVKASNMTPQAVAWELPIVQALSIYHDALWSDGNWTIQPGAPVHREEVADLSPDLD